MNSVPIRHIADVWTSSVDKHTLEGELPIQMCNYTDAYKRDRVRPGPDLMRATATPEEISRNRLRVGDSVFTKDSEDPNDIGISAFVDGEADDFVCGYHLAIARPHPATHPRFLNWALRSRPVLEHFGNHAAGISRYGIGLSDLRSAPIPVVSNDQQRRIADFLDDRVSRIDRIIAARREQVDLVDSRLQSQLSQLMDHQAHLSGLAPLRRFCAGIEQGSSPVGEDRPAEADESGVLKTSAVYRGAFFPERYKAIDPEDADSRYLVRAGDVIVIRGSGSAELVGDAAVARTSSDGPPLHLSDLTYRLQRLDLLPQYAVLALISSRGRAELGSLVRQGSGPAKARGDDIMSISVPIATFDEQSSCVELEAEIREQWMGLTSDLNRSIGLLTEYKSSLITAAVTGELDVSTAGSNILG